MKWGFFLFNILFYSYSFAQGGPLKDSSKQDTTRIDSLINLSLAYQWSDPYQSLRFADEAYELAQEINYKRGIARTNNLKGFCYWSFGDNDLAIQAAIDARQIAEQENYPLILAESFYILARGYMDVAEGEKAGDYIMQAETLAEQGNNWELLSSIYNLKGVILFIDAQYDSALYYYNKAYQTGQDHGVPALHFPRIISNIGECYQIENPAMAFSYFNRALQMAKETGNRITEASITDIIGHAYLRTHDFKNAEANFQTALQLAQTLGLRRVVRHAYSGLVNIKLQQGMGNEAVSYLQKYYGVRDSLMNVSKIRQIVELESKHALLLKEQDIKILENENRIYALWRNFLIAFIILLILISVGVYQLQRYRHRKNRKILNLEIDFLTQQHKEAIEKYKASLIQEPDELLESHDQKLLKKAIAIVDTNMSDPLFSVEKMALEMSMSRTNLHRRLKEITGFPPSELIRSIRLRKAARLIASKVDTVTQIALLVGFDDYSHFSKSFKKHFGVSPTNYADQTEKHLQL